MADQFTKDFAKEEKARVKATEASTTEEPTQAPPLSSVIGNRAMQRMLTGQRGQSGVAAFIQAKMQLDTPGDVYEQEADRVAQSTVANIQRQNQGGEQPQLNEDEGIQRTPILQRQPEEDEEMASRSLLQREPEEEEMSRSALQRDEVDDGEAEEEEEPIQRKGNSLDGSIVDPNVENEINAQRGAGTAIEPGAKQQFEGAMGYDLSGVRVHTDSSADQLSRSVGAKAFTTGSDIFFSSGQYNPGSTDGQLLLGHELTHVVQQGGAAPLKQEGDA